MTSPRPTEGQRWAIEYNDVWEGEGLLAERRAASLSPGTTGTQRYERSPSPRKASTISQVTRRPIPPRDCEASARDCGIPRVATNSGRILESARKLHGIEPQRSMEDLCGSFAMQCHAMPYQNRPCHIRPMPIHAMPFPALPCHSMPCHALPFPVLPCSTMPCHAVQLHPRPCNTMQSHAKPCLVLQGTRH